ncbi:MULTISPECIES: helix-turn-helix transcriptional regulator [Methylobacterium]|uniref:CsgBAC operon transcriptional regulatory protein n=1 Tax=Methylobacterium bullatum TaxID=570505 RepID=A0A679JI92_9HYPH|nr:MULTISPECIES: helix-turn-helix transcriptional regulator [Methylobacterium]KQP52027.1 LuxR family transcriptional regulator [Methylobacterium sp. Leaf106]MBD8904900.1 helix-turn-helix transcriptional regulator [Methylobacterium bullatum]TXN21159.1 helix-turn-helix transcriptional regulator [Methylobacterium sp. WL19]CAA2139498.1 CsgBAC operon transcriptional regulatory protein [Methylobacterium bullatum]GJD42005.1 HTH-type transcriptional regulator MalT [Methylobacterium bullatum]
MTLGVDRYELRQIIAGLSEGVILVEPDQTIAYANEAALAMHGAESVSELGETVDIYRERFSLRYRNNRTPNQYPIERVVAGETFHDVVVEVTRTDEPDVTFVHSLRSLVATDRDGNPSCLALILKDVSDQFEAEDRFEKTFNANPAPAVICRLADLRHVKVNLGFLEMTGYTRDAVIGRSVYEVDVLAGARSRDLAISRLNEGGTIPQMEACLDLPDGGVRHVIVAGQPMEFGEEPCMLFTFADLELRRKAEMALRQSEERFAKAFSLTPVPTVLARANSFAITGVNEAFTRVFGHSAETVAGRSPAELGLWVHDAAREKFESAVAMTGYVLGLEVCLQHEDGTSLDCLVSAERVEIGDDIYALLVLQDITERKRGERDLFEAIETVMADTSWFSRGLIDKLANLRRPGGEHKDSVSPNMTVRERQILDLICSGLGDDAIAKRLTLSRNTVRNHAAALYRKLGVHKRSEAIVWGRNNGFPAGSAG